MKTLLATTYLLTGLFGGATLAQAADCGTLTIASMNWQSSEVLAAVDKIILEEGYDCNVEVVSGDTVPTITSMAEKGQPDIASEAWIDVLPDIVKRGVDEKKLVIAATVLPDGGVNGWWIPKYLADAHPEIKTIQDALRHPELFPHPEDASKGAIYNAPQGWGGAIVTAQLFKAYEAEKAGFELVDPGSPGALDASIARAYENKEAWLGFYWAPTALLGKYEMVKLDWGVPLDEAEWKRCVTVLDCPDPKPSAWPVDHVVTLVSTRFADGADPAVMGYLNKRGWSNETVGKLMAWMTDNQATGEDGAWHFLEENKDVWTQWVSPEAAEKVEAAM